jgi:hypothetical protein
VGLLIAVGAPTSLVVTWQSAATWALSGFTSAVRTVRYT